MAKKKATKAGASRRKRRTPEEMIADLQAQIEQVKQRAQARELKESPAMKRSITLMRAMNKAMAEAAEEKNSGLQHALKDAYQALAGYLEGQGVRPPKARMTRGRRPRG